MYYEDAEYGPINQRQPPKLDSLLAKSTSPSRVHRGQSGTKQKTTDQKRPFLMGSEIAMTVLASLQHENKPEYDLPDRGPSNVGKKGHTLLF